GFVARHAQGLYPSLHGAIGHPLPREGTWVGARGGDALDRGLPLGVERGKLIHCAHSDVAEFDGVLTPDDQADVTIPDQLRLAHRPPRTTLALQDARRLRQRLPPSRRGPRHGETVGEPLVVLL